MDSSTKSSQEYQRVRLLRYHSNALSVRIFRQHGEHRVRWNAKMLLELIGAFQKRHGVGLSFKLNTALAHQVQSFPTGVSWVCIARLDRVATSTGLCRCRWWHERRTLRWWRSKFSTQRRRGWSRACRWGRWGKRVWFLVRPRTCLIDSAPEGLTRGGPGKFRRDGRS